MARGIEYRRIRILSLGAGVQSSAIYLMAVTGKFGDAGPILAVFADTQWERRETYENLDYLESIGGNTIPIVRVTAGDLRRDALTQITPKKVDRKHDLLQKTSIPMYTINSDTGKIGVVTRRCTPVYKIAAIDQAVRKHLKLFKGEWFPDDVTVEQWIGISTDEATRVKDPRVAYYENFYPLIELGMSRADCVRWFSDNGFKVPTKSSCVACPYTSNRRWLDMKENHPEEFADAVDFERSLEELRQSSGIRLGPAFLHPDRVPLNEVDFAAKIKTGYGSRGGDDDDINLFENECEGMCGL